MASSINTRGALPTNPFGNTSGGLLGGLNSIYQPKQQTGFSAQQANQVAQSGGGQYTPATNAGGGQSIAPQKGLLDQHDTSDQHVLSKSDSQGNTIKFAPPSNPTTPTPQAGTPQYYANKEEQVSQPNALGQGSANASALYGMLGNEAKLAPFAGGTTQGLLQSYANLTHPQSTGNMAGEQGLFNVQNGILQNAANTSADQALKQQQVGQTGYNNLLGAAIPQAISPGSSLYNPLEGSSGFNPTAGATRGAAYGALGPAYTDMNQAQGTLQNIQDNTNLFNTLIPKGVNISPATPLNQLANKVGSLFSSQAYGQFNAILPNIVSQYASYIGSTKGLTPSDAFAQASQEINTNSSIGTIQKVLDTLSKEAGNTLSAKQKVYNDALSSYSSGSAKQDNTGGGGLQTWDSYGI